MFLGSRNMRNSTLESTLREEPLAPYLYISLNSLRSRVYSLGPCTLLSSCHPFEPSTVVAGPDLFFRLHGPSVLSTRGCWIYIRPIRTCRAIEEQSMKYLCGKHLFRLRWTYVNTF